MKTKSAIIEFIYSEYYYYYSYLKGLQERVRRLNINDIQYIVFTKTIVDVSLKLDELKKIIDFIEIKEDK